MTSSTLLIKLFLIRTREIIARIAMLSRIIMSAGITKKADTARAEPAFIADVLLHEKEACAVAEAEVLFVLANNVFMTFSFSDLK